MIGVIDFDGTFLKNDYFKESFYKKVIENPFYLLNHFLIKRKNLLSLKFELLKDFSPEYEIELLINPEVKKWILENKHRYSKLILVSASPDFFVHKILSQVDCFDEVYGSTEVNLQGLQKLEFIKAKLGTDFDYLGDSKADIPIFRNSQNAFKVTNKGIIHVA
jgi:phosphoserine phosphatase